MADSFSEIFVFLLKHFDGDQNNSYAYAQANIDLSVVEKKINYLFSLIRFNISTLHNVIGFHILLYISRYGDRLKVTRSPNLSKSFGFNIISFYMYCNTQSNLLRRLISVSCIGNITTTCLLMKGCSGNIGNI